MTMDSMAPSGALVNSPADTMLVPVGNTSTEELPRLVAVLRRSARAAECDVQFLQRRVQKLRAEEEHVWKKLESAREQKEKAEAARLRHQREHEARVAHKQRLVDEQSRERARLHDERDAQRHSLFLARSKLAMQRREQSSMVRRESRELSKEREQHEVANSKTVALNHQLIMDMHQRVVASRNQSHESLQRQREQLHESETLRLRDKQNQHVSDAATLLTEEAQLIHRLQQIKRETTSVLSATASSSTPSPRKPPRPPSQAPYTAR